MKMSNLPVAQKLLLKIGVEPQLVLLGSSGERSRSHTKKGTGRIPYSK